MQIKLNNVVVVVAYWFDKSFLSPFDLQDKKLIFFWILSDTRGTSSPILSN